MRVPKSWAVRIGAVAATLAIAGSGAAVAANAATGGTAAPAAPAALHRIATTLTVHKVNVPGHPHAAIIIGRLHTTVGNVGLRGKWVLLQRQGARGHWFAVRAERTRRHGFVAFVVRVGRHAVNFRLRFPGTFRFAPSVSAVETVS